MTALQSSGLEPAVRLKSLKNANRRVMPGEEEIADLNKFNPDVAGTANPMPAPAPTQNVPQPAIGSQVSPQSYDTRANQVMTAPPAPVGPPQPVMANPNPPPSQEPGMNEKRLGEALPSAVGTQPPQATEEAQIPYGPQLPPYPLLGSGLKGFLKKGPGLRGEALQKEMEQQAQAIKEAKPYGPEEKPPERVGFKPPGIVPYETNPITEAWQGFIKGGKERQKQMIEQAQGEKAPTPEVAAQAGQPPISEQEQAIEAHQYHTDQVASQPELVQKFEEQTGKQLTPELQQEVRGAEQVMGDLTDGGNAVDTGDDDQAKRLKERIINNQATDADKYMIGLALVMPLIVGGMFGKEAGFGALAGGMKGMGEAYSRRAKDTQEAEELLAEINKNKAAKEAATAKADTTSGLKDVEWTDRNTGEKKTGKAIAPGMYMSKEDLSDKELKKDAIKSKNDLQEKIYYSNPIIEASQLISDISKQIKDPSFFTQYMRWKMSNFDPALGAKLSQKVIIDGEEVNAATAIQEALVDANNNYAQMHGLGQPDAAEQRLFYKKMGDPTAGFMTAEQSRYQADKFKIDTINSILNDAKIKGIYLDPEMFPYAQKKSEIESTKKAKSGARLASKEIGEL